MRNCKTCIFVKENSDNSLYCIKNSKGVNCNYFCSKHIIKGRAVKV